jgi:cell division protease FtsH
VSIHLPGSEAVHKVSIIPRGIGALGYTISRPTEDRYLMTQEELERKMAVLLGGRAAEQLIFNRVTTGAADDLVRVSEIARSMVTRYGMSKKLGQLAYENGGHSFLGQPGAMPPEYRTYSEDTAKEIDQAVREIVDAAFQQATQILQEKRDALVSGAKILLEKETLTEDEVLAIAKG